MFADERWERVYRTADRVHMHGQLSDEDIRIIHRMMTSPSDDESTVRRAVDLVVDVDDTALFAVITLTAARRLGEVITGLPESIPEGYLRVVIAPLGSGIRSVIDARQHLRAAVHAAVHGATLAVDVARGSGSLPPAFVALATVLVEGASRVLREDGERRVKDPSAGGLDTAVSGL